MFRFVLAAIFFLGCTAPVAVQAPVPTQEQVEQARTERIQRQVLQTIYFAHPAVSERRALRIRDTIIEESRRHDLPPLVLTGILAHESEFRYGVESCYPRSDGEFTCDLGLGQVNYDVWGEHLKLDRDRLVKDDRYNIRVAARILGHLQRLHRGESRWWTRYHSATPSRRVTYYKLVERRLPSLVRRL